MGAMSATEAAREAAGTVAATKVRPPAECLVRRVLRIPDDTAGSKIDAQRAFSQSITISAIRCLLTYIVLPFVAPVLGWASGVEPWVGIPIGVVAIVFNVRSIRRFWVADHRWRWGYTVIGLSVIGLLVVLVVRDVLDVVT